jgi:hypothetical protein
MRPLAYLTGIELGVRQHKIVTVMPLLVFYLLISFNNSSQQELLVRSQIIGLFLN